MPRYGQLSDASDYRVNISVIHLAGGCLDSRTIPTRGKSITVPLIRGHRLMNYETRAVLEESPVSLCCRRALSIDGSVGYAISSVPSGRGVYSGVRSCAGYRALRRPAPTLSLPPSCDLEAFLSSALGHVHVTDKGRALTRLHDR
jgi:hypothetical protein